MPLKTIGQSSVLVGDVGKAVDAQAIQTNIVRVDGQPSVYLPILKQGGDTNTIAVVDGIRSALQHLVDIPKQLVTRVVFDQSVFVKTAIDNLIHEGAIGLVLTGVMILLFLRQHPRHGGGVPGDPAFCTRRVSRHQHRWRHGQHHGARRIGLGLLSFDR